MKELVRLLEDVTMYKVKGAGINSNLGLEPVELKMGSNFDIDKGDYDLEQVNRKAMGELKRWWGSDAVRLYSIEKMEEDDA